MTLPQEAIVFGISSLLYWGLGYRAGFGRGLEHARNVYQKTTQFYKPKD